MDPEATIGHASATVESTGTASSFHKGDPEMSGSEVENHVLDTVDEAEIRRAVRKMDLTILPIMTMFYLLSFLVNLFFIFIWSGCILIYCGLLGPC